MVIINYKLQIILLVIFRIVVMKRISLFMLRRKFIIFWFPGCKFSAEMVPHPKYCPKKQRYEVGKGKMHFRAKCIHIFNLQTFNSENLLISFS